MTQINQLSSTDDLSGSDLVPVWSQINGDTRKVSLTNLAKQVQTLNSESLTDVTQFETPVAGANIAIASATANTWLVLGHTSTIASLTIILPDASVATDGLEIVVSVRASVTSLTWQLNGASALQSTISSLSNSSAPKIKFYKATNTWYRYG
jgi:hypothetical protein